MCEAVIERNQLQMAKASKRAALEAWRQVIEVILTACPEDLLSAEMRQNVIFELLHELLHKVCIRIRKQIICFSFSFKYFSFKFSHFSYFKGLDM